MPASSIIIISGGGGGNRMTVNYSVPYPVSTGDAIENTATSGQVEVTFTDSSMVTTDIFLAAGQKYTFTVSGAIVVQP